MFDYFYYYPLSFLNPMFSLVLIICLGIITPYIIILANKDKDYKNKKLFIIYEKAISILLILHIVLTLINFINFIRIINFISNLIIGAVGIAIIYGICYILKNNDISLNINKYLKLEKKMNKEKICKNCGKQINNDFKICPYCGEKAQDEITEKGTNNYEVSPKNGIACLLLFLFLGEFGAHRYYAGKKVSGFIMLILSSILFSIYTSLLYDYLTSLYDYLIASLSGHVVVRNFPSLSDAIFISIIPSIILSVWWITDLISIARDKFKDSKGRYIKLSNSSNEPKTTKKDNNDNDYNI